MPLSAPLRPEIKKSGRVHREIRRSWRNIFGNQENLWSL
jgi:hypothetical protein